MRLAVIGQTAINSSPCPCPGPYNPHRQDRDITHQIRLTLGVGGGKLSLFRGRKGKAYPVGGGLPGCRNSTCHFAAPLLGLLQLQGWGLATGAGQAGSGLIPHPLPRLTVVPEVQAGALASRMLGKRRRHCCLVGRGQPRPLL